MTNVLRPSVIVALTVGLLFVAVTPAGSVPVAFGRIVVNNDEWMLSDTAFAALPADTARLALNVATWFLDGVPLLKGKFLAFSNNFGLTQAQLAATMRGAGHTWDVTADPAQFTLVNLLKYDGVFLCGMPVPNAGVLGQYLTLGGNVYLAAGTGVFGGDGQPEADAWNPTLQTVGLRLGAPYNQVNGAFAVNNPHPVLAGVNAVFQLNGNDVSELNPADVKTDILASVGGHGLIGVAMFTVPAAHV